MLSGSIIVMVATLWFSFFLLLQLFSFASLSPGLVYGSLEIRLVFPTRRSIFFLPLYVPSAAAREKITHPLSYSLTIFQMCHLMFSDLYCIHLQVGAQSTRLSCRRRKVFLIFLCIFISIFNGDLNYTCDMGVRRIDKFLTVVFPRIPLIWILWRKHTSS